MTVTQRHQGSEAEPLLNVSDLETVFQTEKGTLRAVDHVSFEVGRGEIVGLVGESGAGKSATARSVLRLIESPGEIAGGSIQFDGEEVLEMEEERLRQYRGSETGFIFQEPSAALNPTMTVGKQIREAVETHESMSEGETRERTIELLEQVGIPNPADQYNEYPHEFSGGQKQRIVIAIALAGDPDFLIADEPTTALDVTIQAQILDLLRSLREEYDMGILFITHDLGVVRELCDRVAVMYAGSVVETGPVEELFTAPRHPYTAGLIASIPDLTTTTPEASGARRGHRLDIIEGTMPSLYGQATECKYADRCPGATEDCRAAHPDLEQLTDTRQVACFRHEEIEEFEYEYEHQQRSLSWNEPASVDTDRNGSSSENSLLEVEDLNKHFTSGGIINRLIGESAVRAVDGIDLTIERGETVGLVGESGCGKSTAARAILRLLQPTSGRVRYRDLEVTEASDKELRSLRSDAQMVFQDPKSSLNPRRTVRNTVARAMKLHHSVEGDELDDWLLELLEEVGLGETHLNRYPNELSGGQQQRVGIARALAVGPSFVVADEPVSGLDVSVQAKILNLLADLQDDLGLSYLFISHDLSVVKFVSDKIAVMYLGKIVEYGTVDEVFQPPYHPYTEALLSAIPGLIESQAAETARGTTDGSEPSGAENVSSGVEQTDGERTSRDGSLGVEPDNAARRIILEGDVPNPSNIASGCRFHPRCPRKIGAVCEEETPQAHGEGHQIKCHLMREEYEDDVVWEQSPVSRFFDTNGSN